MVEFFPRGKIYLLQDVPLDNSYEDTIYWGADEEQAQETYFKSKCPNTTTLSFDESNYQRVNSGTLLIRGVAERIMECNYLMFKNGMVAEEEGVIQPLPVYESMHWFYCFITDVTFKSTYCAEVHYEIDVMQTFHFHYNLGYSFVDREHSETDGIGDNIIDEGLPIGDYDYSTISENWTPPGSSVSDTIPVFSGANETVIVVASTFNDQYQNFIGYSIANTYSGLFFKWFANNTNGRALLANYLYGASVAGKIDGVVAVFLMPKVFADIVDLQSTPQLNHNINKARLTTGNFGNYTPKNNKMYTYPYNTFIVYNNQGNLAEYKIEKFSGTDCQFVQYLDFSCSPSSVLTPVNYSGIAFNSMESITLGPFPQLSWVSDTYKAWIAQNSAQLISSVAVGTAQTAAGLAVPGMGVTSVIGLIRVIDTLAKVTDMQVLPIQAHGNVYSNQASCNMNQFYFHGHLRRVREDYARSIDNFFTMFGYKANRYKIPNRYVRKEFTYTKTVECTIIGDRLPDLYLKKIKSIYDNGIRFWKDPNMIGTYVNDNSPLP